MNPKNVLKFASDQGAKFVSVRFTDLPGSWQHLTFPIGELGEEQFEDGFGFDASSIRGWAAIHVPRVRRVRPREIPGLLRSAQKAI